MSSLSRSQRLLISVADLTWANKYATEFLQRVYGTCGDADDPVAMALAIAMVVGYWRPFSGNRDRDGRKERWLARGLEDALDDEERELHRMVGRARNRLYAHSDASAHEFETVELGDRVATHWVNPLSSVESNTQLATAVRKLSAAMLPRLEEMIREEVGERGLPLFGYRRGREEA